MNQHISLLLLTKNEQENIKNNFGWIKKCPIIDEIFIVDDFSTDNTKKAVSTLKTDNTNIIFKTRKLDSNFSAQRNYGISFAKNKWILWLDADEIPTPSFLKFLNNFGPKNKTSYSFIRQNIFWNKVLNYGESNQRLVRLFDKTSGKFQGKVHEIWQTNKTTQKTNIKFLHQTNQNITSLLNKINFYTDIRSKELYVNKTKTSIFQIIFYPLAKFTQNYFIKLGCLDGTRGIIISLVMSFHSFLVRTKLWQLYNQSSSI